MNTTPVQPVTLEVCVWGGACVEHVLSQKTLTGKLTKTMNLARIGHELTSDCFFQDSDSFTCTCLCIVNGGGAGWVEYM